MHAGTIGLVIVAIALGGPLLLGLTGLVARRAGGTGAASPWDWRLTAHSALLYAIAFNLTFFIQELFLVVPKALTPGLRPTLYHNNHDWTGDHPLENLFQGTGALAILLTGLLFAWLVARRAGPTPTWRLFFVWMAYNGLIQSLPQFVVGALVPENDVGRAMDYFAMSPSAKLVTGGLALAAAIAAGLWLTRPMLELAGRDERIASAGGRTRFMLNAATVPALLAIPLIILFRVPREAIEVALPPVVVTIAGLSWMQANAWRAANARSTLPPGTRALVGPLLWALAILLAFQLVLRPGIAFY